MLIRLADGTQIDKENAVEIRGKLVNKKYFQQCPQCNDYFKPILPLSHCEDTETPYVNDSYYCCGACVLDSKLKNNEYGDYFPQPNLGQIDFYPHRNGTRLHKTSHQHPFLIGFEIEKEDPIYYEKLRDPKVGLKIPAGWICMKDTSLKNQGGFELISPAYNLTKDKARISKDLKEYKELIGSNYSKWCGGHISVSKKGFSGACLAKQQQPLLCFFLTLFPARMRNINIKQLTFNECIFTQQKHKPFHTESNGRFELRMIAAVKNSKQLMRRIKTIEWFLVNQPSFATTYYALKNKNGFLRKLYAPVYGYERWNEFIARFTHMSLWFCKGKYVNKITEIVERDEME